MRVQFRIFVVMGTNYYFLMVTFILWNLQNEEIRNQKLNSYLFLFVSSHTYTLNRIKSKTNTVHYSQYIRCDQIKYK